MDNNFNNELENQQTNQNMYQQTQQFNQINASVQPVEQPQYSQPEQMPNSNETKKSKLGLIIGLSVAVIVVIAGIIIIPGLINKDQIKTEKDNSESQNMLTIGDQKVKILNNYSADTSEINGFGLFKINDEYVFKGGDNYTEIDKSGNTLLKYEQGYLNNIVKFNNNYWRIIKINSDGTIKLIYFGTLVDNKIINKLDLQIQYFDELSDDSSYENSNVRKYLNSDVLNNTTLIPSNYSKYLVKGKFDVSTYNIYLKDIIGEKIISDFEDYIGLISVSEYNEATYCYWITTSTGYRVQECDNYIDDILNTAVNTIQLKTNTTNMVVNEEGRKVGVVKIGRNDGEFELRTEYNVDIKLNNNVLPVVTLKSTVEFNGNGTFNDPYIVK